jgi:hypothetical protein
MFTSTLKRAVANRTLQYSAKYQDTYMLPNNSYTIITCNADPESLRILPDTNQNVLDKVILLLAEKPTKGFVFPANATVIVDKELPFFARYLQDIEVPKQYLEESRFGIKSYHHPELLETARSSTVSHSFKELLDIFFAQYFRNEPNAQTWEGSSTRLLQEMYLDESLKEIAKCHKPVTIGRYLAQLMNQKYPITQTRNNHARGWIVDRSFVPGLS